MHLYMKVDIIFVKNSRNKGGFSGPDDVLVYIVKGVQNMQNWGEGCIFGHIYKHCKELDGQIKKKH